MKEILVFTILLSVSSLALGNIAMGDFPRGINKQGISQASDDKKQQLLFIIRDKALRKSDPDRVASAIVQLGEMKSVESIGDLIELLSFRRTLKGENPDPNTVQEIHPVAPSERYPATGALVSIGTPSLEALVRVIATQEAGSVESDNAIFAVSMIFRENLQEGVSYLQSAASASLDRPSMDRLRAAANRLDNQVKELKKSG